MNDLHKVFHGSISGKKQVHNAPDLKLRGMTVKNITDMINDRRRFDDASIMKKKQVPAEKTAGTCNHRELLPGCLFH